MNKSLRLVPPSLPLENRRYEVSPGQSNLNVDLKILAVLCLEAGRNSSKS